MLTFFIFILILVRAPLKHLKTLIAIFISPISPLHISEFPPPTTTNRLRPVTLPSRQKADDLENSSPP